MSVATYKDPREALTGNKTALSAAYQTPNGQTYYNDQIPAAMSAAGQPAAQQAGQTAVPKSAYTPSAAVNQAQQKMQNYETQKPGEYQQGDQVTAAYQQLQNLLANKPQGYNSKYGQQLDSMLEQIQNPTGFKYEFNGDELFKYYADDYTRRGKQASMDVMGQAAALTGGYGNSYAQQAGQQAYDEYLMGLYEKGMELRNAAYQQYKDQRADLYNQFGVLNQLDESEYGRHRDEVGDWQNEVGRLTDAYNNERNFDYGKHRDTVGDWNNEMARLTDAYNNERNFDYGQYTDTRDFNEKVREYEQDFNEQKRQYEQNFNEQKRQYDQDYAEKVRQFNESLDWDKMSSEQKYAMTYAMQILAMGQMPSDEMLQAAGLSAADAEKMRYQEPVMAAAGGGGSGSGITTLYADRNGNLFTEKNGKKQAVSKETIEKNPSKYVVDDKTYYDTVMGQKGTSGLVGNTQQVKKGSTIKGKKPDRVK